MIQKTFFAILFLAASVAIPFFFEELLKLFVIYLPFGWTVHSIFIRVIVIFLFAASLYFFVKLFRKNHPVKFSMILLISLLPGFGISFISPIYNIDYGNLSDSKSLDQLTALEITNDQIKFPQNEKFLIGFFSVTCGHCYQTATKLAINQEAGQSIPVIAIFSESEGDYEEFIKITGADKFICYAVSNDPLILSASDGTFPSVYLIDENRNTLRHWVGEQLNYSALDFLIGLK